MLTRILGYQQITDLSSAVGFTSVPSGAAYVRIQAEDRDVRWRDDGTSPTASVGMLLYEGALIEYEGDFSAIEFIEAAASAILNATFYGYQDVTLTGDLDILELVAGNDYYFRDGRELSWTGDDWPDLTGATVALRIPTGATVLSVAGTIVTAGIGVTQEVRFELSDTNTAGLPGASSWEVTYTKGASTVRLVGGNVTTRKAVS
jgi:hypothetical protein